MDAKRSRCQLLLITIVALLAAASANGQDNRQSSGDVTGEVTEKAPLSLKLGILNSTVCVGTSVALELEIKNVGKEEIRMDKADLWSSYSYGGPVPNPECQFCGRGGGQEILEDRVLFFPVKEVGRHYISLFPGTTYWDKHDFELNEFFIAAGKYSISTRLPYFIGDERKDPISSNREEFELIQCGPITKRLEQL